MNLFIKIVFILFASFAIIGCKNDSEKSKSLDDDVQKSITINDSIQEGQKISFKKTLSLLNISFEIITHGEGSIRQLTIQPKGLEIDNNTIYLKIDGQVVNAEIEDLNLDGFPELLIYTVSAGSGSYGNVIGYSVNNGKSLSQIYFPDLSENKDAFTGYMGHDEFTIVETTLVRRFPIYKDGDTNNNPTGGTRQIQYKLKNGESNRLFVIEKTIDY